MKINKLRYEVQTCMCVRYVTIHDTNIFLEIFMVWVIV